MKGSLILIGAVGLMALVVWCLLPEHKTPITTLPCADIVSGCGNQNIQIHFDQIPQAMQPFRLQIDTANALRVKQVHASFTMQGMDMGLNRYRLLSQVNGATQTNGVWIANITLPVCTQGQSDWRMTVELQTTTTTEQYQLAFANRPATRHSNKP